MSGAADVVEAVAPEVLDLLGVDIPPAIVRPVVALLGGIIGVVLAGDDSAKRFEALARTAEKLKAELDAAKFGPR